MHQETQSVCPICPSPRCTSAQYIPFLFAGSPDYVGIDGNENADKTAKSALNSHITAYHYHILQLCRFWYHSPEFYTASSLKHLFHRSNIHPKWMISFMHTIGLKKTLTFLWHDIAAICLRKMPSNRDKLNPNYGNCQCQVTENVQHVPSNWDQMHFNSVGNGLISDWQYW